MMHILSFLSLNFIGIISLLGQSLDQYRGYTGLKGTEPGQWHTERIDDREWFITPEGNAMYVLGINHIDTNDDQQQTLSNLAQWNFNSSGYGAPVPVIEEFPGFISVRLHDAPQLAARRPIRLYRCI